MLKSHYILESEFHLARKPFPFVKTTGLFKFAKSDIAGRKKKRREINLGYSDTSIFHFKTARRMKFEVHFINNASLS